MSFHPRLCIAVMLLTGTLPSGLHFPHWQSFGHSPGPGITCSFFQDQSDCTCICSAFRSSGSPVSGRCVSTQRHMGATWARFSVHRGTGDDRLFAGDPDLCRCVVQQDVSKTQACIDQAVLASLTYEESVRK